MYLTRPTRFLTVSSSIGLLTLAGNGDCLTHLVLQDAAHQPGERSQWVHDPAAFPDVVAQLAEYFAGERSTFDVALCPAGTSFQKRVWYALREIHYGQTRSYGEIASRIGQPGAARAVGLANARNPIAVIVPCHRVVGADGALTGYAGGLQTKQALLDLEEAHDPGSRRRQAGPLAKVTAGAGAKRRETRAVGRIQ